MTKSQENFFKYIENKIKFSFVEKRKIKNLKSVLFDVFAHIEGAEKYIKERLTEVCPHEKISVNELIYFL